MAAPSDTAPTRRETLWVVLVGAAVFALAAYRASVGLSFYDDSFYAVTAWRYAHGARFLVDELSLQTLGGLIAVPLVWVWERIAGTTGLVLAVRLLWVALAGAAAWVGTRLLARSTRLGVAALAMVLPLLAPAYNVFAPTYNTASSLLLTLAVVLGFSAMRDDSPALAAWMGIATALGSMLYPPLAPAGLMLLATFAGISRDRRLVTRAGLAAVAAAAVVGAMLLLGRNAGDIRAALAFQSANVPSILSPLAKFSYAFGNTGRALVQPLLWPMWLLAALASARGVRSDIRSLSLAAIPAAAALPGVLLLARGDSLTFGTSMQSWLLTVCAGVLLPCLLALRRLELDDLYGYLKLAAPFSAVGYVTVAYVTNSSFNRGMPFIALAPVAVGLLLVWGSTLADEGTPRTFPAASGVTLLVAFALLFSSVFGDASFWRADVRLKSGAYAGILTSGTQARRLAQFSQKAPRWVTPGSTVTFLGQEEAYLASGGTPLTPATWLFLGPADAAAIAYFNRQGRLPDVIFVSDADVAYERRSGSVETDPMLRWVQTNYRKVDQIGGFSVYARP